MITSSQFVAQSPTSELLELHLSCTSLADKDTFSKSDPFVTAFLSTNKSPLSQVGSTEVVQNNLNPTFKKGIPVTYIYEMVQTVTVRVFDYDDGGDHDFLGEATFSLASVLMAPPDGLSQPLALQGKQKGFIRVRFSKIGESKRIYTFKFNCTQVKDIEFWSKSDPFLRIFRPTTQYMGINNGDQIPPSGWVQVHETEPVMNNLNPNFRQFTIPSANLNGGNSLVVNKYEIWDYESDGQHRVISSGYAAVAQLEKGQLKSILTLDPKQKFAGNINLEYLQAKRVCSIPEYIAQGLRFNLTVGIDFTGSNGVPSSPSSLHYFGPGAINNPAAMNQYMQAIAQVGQVVIEYDDDKLVPAFGYGAKIDGGPTSHCFPLNLNPENPFCKGPAGVLLAYTSIIPRIELSGPTNFAPIINECVKAASIGFTQNKWVYTVLMILTDGLITDFPETLTAIIKASRLPMSIIIIGVGNAEFGQMDALDSDNQMLRDHFGNTAARDIVQFVPFNTYKTNPSMLAAEVLKELPRQVDQFYASLGMQPPEVQYK